MNNDIYSIDFTQIFPTALQHDPKMIALAKGFAAEALKVSGHLNDVLIYSRFDELPEALVDILAYDMHVDWYDYDMPLKVKREVVKNSVRVHKRMGTKYAVETALGSVWPESEVEEWFEYGGEPHHFRIVCDVTESYITCHGLCRPSICISACLPIWKAWCTRRGLPASYRRTQIILCTTTR